MRSILLLPLVARCLECIWRMFFYVCCSDCVGVCGNSCVAAVVKNSGVLSLGMLKYVVCLCSGCDGCSVFCLYCEAWSCRCSCMGSVECFVRQMLYVCVLCASCGCSQCCGLHEKVRIEHKTKSSKKKCTGDRALEEKF